MVALITNVHAHCLISQPPSLRLEVIYFNDTDRQYGGHEGNDDFTDRYKDINIAINTEGQFSHQLTTLKKTFVDDVMGTVLVINVASISSTWMICWLFMIDEIFAASKTD